jgi:hypothetical protein
MSVPSPRNPIKPARGDYSDLSSNVASLENGEICYAIDQDQLYVVENGSLVPASGSLANLTDLSLSTLNNGDALIYNNGSWANGGTLNGGAF